MLQRAVATAAKPAGRRALSTVAPFHIAVPVHDLEQGAAAINRSKMETEGLEGD